MEALLEALLLREVPEKLRRGRGKSNSVRRLILTWTERTGVRIGHPGPPLERIPNRARIEPESCSFTAKLKVGTYEPE